MRQSYSSILPDDNDDIFGAFLLISHNSFSSLILSSFVLFSFYTFSKVLHRKGLSDARVISKK